MRRPGRAVEPLYFGVIQRGLAHFAGPLFKDEVNAAKHEFFQPLTIPTEASPQYESRMSQFFDWYFFTRPMRGFQQTPLESLFLSRELRFDAEEMVLIDHLRHHRHGLFEFLKQKGDAIIIYDLLKKEKVTIHDPNFTFSLQSDEIFEARLVPYDDNWLFMKGFCFHPVEATKYILGEVKRHRKDPDLNPDELMLRLLEMNMRIDQYRHVPIPKVYSAEGLPEAPRGVRS